MRRAREEARRGPHKSQAGRSLRGGQPLTVLVGEVDELLDEARLRGMDSGEAGRERSGSGAPCSSFERRMRRASMSRLNIISTDRISWRVSVPDLSSSSSRKPRRTCEREGERLCGGGRGECSGGPGQAE